MTAEQLTDVVCEAIEIATAPLLQRIAVLEARSLERGERGEQGEPGRDGKDADAAAIQIAIAEAVALAMSGLPKPKDGVDGHNADPETIRKTVADEVAKAVAMIPVPKDGRSVDVADLAPVIAAEVQKAVAGIATPKDGQSVTIADVAPLIADEVQKAVAALPAPKDGQDGRSVERAEVAALVVEAVAALPAAKSLTADDVRPVIVEEVRRAAADIPVPKDGVGLCGAVIDRDGQLVLTLSDGSMKVLGTVVARDVDMAAVEATIREALASWPKPVNGKDGADGLGFEELDAVYDEHGRLSLRFSRGAIVKTFRVPGIVDRGVYREGDAYEKGDGVTWGGSFWIAQKDTSAKPETNADWRLATKRGRDGKQGQPGPEGKSGLHGKDGKDGRDRG